MTKGSDTIVPKGSTARGGAVGVSRLRGNISRHLAALNRSPFRLLITFAATNAGWNMVVLQRCRLQYSLFRPILPSLHRPLGALGSNPPHAGTAFGLVLPPACPKRGGGCECNEQTEGLKKKVASLGIVNPSVNPPCGVLPAPRPGSLLGAILYAKIYELTPRLEQGRLTHCRS